ncbi:hypothetical protein Hanom_Chr12g01089291 [Helianthus anomalus]
MKRHIPFPLWIDVYLTRSNSKTNQLLPTLYFSANVFLYPHNRLLCNYMENNVSINGYYVSGQGWARCRIVIFISIVIYNNNPKNLLLYICMSLFCFIYSKVSIVIFSVFCSSSYVFLFYFCTI